MWRAFFKDPKFLRITLAICLVSPLLGQLAVFSSVFAFRELGFKAQTAAWLGMTTAGTRLALSPAAGWLTDKWGARPSLLMWAALAGCGFIFLALMPGNHQRLRRRRHLWCGMERFFRSDERPDQWHPEPAKPRRPFHLARLLHDRRQLSGAPDDRPPL
jgi:hypothetical protein